MYQGCCLNFKTTIKQQLFKKQYSKISSENPKIITKIQCCLQTYKHKSHDGVELEILKRTKNSDQNKPPLIFLHGWNRAAWSFEENFLPYFSELGYPCYALSFRGQGGSDKGDGPVAGSIQEHVDDIAHFIQNLKINQETKLAPVIVGHSFGGFLAQVYVSEMAEKVYPQIGGVALMCCVSPTGKFGFFQKITQIDIREFLRILWVLLTKSFENNMEDVKFVFYSDDVEVDKLQRYFVKLQEAKNWADIISGSDYNNKNPLSKPEVVPPAFVFGAIQDRMMHIEATKELAEWLDVQPVLIDNIGHDCILDTRWREVADSISTWLSGIK